MAWQRISTTTGPTELPVEVSELRDHLTLEIDADDALLLSLLQAAVDHAENITHRRFISQQVQMVLPDFPRYEIILPLGKALSVQGIAYIDENEATVNLSGPSDSPAGTSWQEDLSDDESPIIIPNIDADWPGVTLDHVTPVIVSWTAGYGEDGDSVPAALKLALKLQASKWYEARWDGEAPLQVEPMFMNAIAPFKVIRYAH